MIQRRYLTMEIMGAGLANQILRWDLFVPFMAMRAHSH
jgi:hypothetical protein